MYDKREAIIPTTTMQRVYLHYNIFLKSRWLFGTNFYVLIF